MVGYKRLDLAIEACHMADCPLVVAGAGPQESALRALAAELGARVEFVILPSDEKLRELYRAARLLIFPAEEDFGIVPVEAQACGTPVVAFGGGGSVDTVVDGITGTLVAVQSREDFAKGLRFALEAGFDPVRCRQNAERFSVTAFQSKIIDWVGGAARDRGIDLVLSR
jgi:glycosyltransferase involved in cell wall biosynthesis